MRLSRHSEKCVCDGRSREKAADQADVIVKDASKVALGPDLAPLNAPNLQMPPSSLSQMLMPWRGQPNYQARAERRRRAGMEWLMQ